MELGELKRYLEINSKAILSSRVEPLGTEYDIIKHELAKLRILRIANREIEIPGLTRNLELILQVITEQKTKEKRNILPVQYAKSDDLVAMPLRLEHIAANIQAQRALTLAADKYVGEFGIIPQSAVGANTTVFDIPIKQIIIVTDVIELYSPVGLTGVRVRDVDGLKQYALDATLSFKATDMQIFELPHPIIADTTLAIDGKLESPTAAATVTTTPWVVGVWIGYGKDVPLLARP